MPENNFTFELSLSVLNHLGRNLYRNFITVLGEAVSNSWDADAKNVWIDIDLENNSLTIQDDGSGMTSEEFQDKFLRIGYSKRATSGAMSPGLKRPYIGRKGIGKLALLSCADRISVLTKTDSTTIVGGAIDNRKLDEAITEDLKTSDYFLEPLSDEVRGKTTNTTKAGTIVHFENLHTRIKNRIEYLDKLIALNFRFSLLDASFKIFLNNEEVTIKSLDQLIKQTEYLWCINQFEDPYISRLASRLERGLIHVTMPGGR